MQPKCSYRLSHGDFVPASQTAQRDFVSLGRMGFQPMASMRLRLMGCVFGCILRGLF